MRLHDFLDHQARQRPDTLFAIEDERSLTYLQAQAEVNRLAHALIGAGVEMGDRVAVVAKNSIEFVLLYFAVSKAGAILVPLNYRLPAAELAELVVHSNASTLFVGREFVSTLGELRSELSIVRLFITIDGTSPKGWVDYRKFIMDAPCGQPERPVTERDDLCIFYTSGTTGRPKGVIQTHQSMVNAQFLLSLDLRASPADRWLVSLPIFHSAGAMYSAMPCVVSGGCMIVHREFSPSAMVRALEEHSVAFTLTSSMIVREIIREYFAVPGSEGQRFVSLKALIYGAAPFGEATLRRAMEVFGGKLVQGYGTTEANGITMLTPEDHRRAISDRPTLCASAGRPIPGTEIRIVGPDGRSVALKERGEIVARTPASMRGYWQKPEGTAETLADDWIRTGDVGHLDNEGYLYVEGRVIDTITSMGETIYPFEVEAVLRQHPAVADLAVIGVFDSSGREAVKAVVTLRPGSQASEKDLIDFCAGRLNAYKCPRSVDFIDALPKNPFGRVLKRELRASYSVGERSRMRSI